MKIAIVDDSKFSRNQLKRQIQKIRDNIEFEEYPDGASALEHLPGTDAQVLFLDLVMPPPDGLEVLEKLKGDGFAPPIFVVTADIQQSTRERCLELGCEDFIEKPMSAEKISKAMERINL